jgi:hypothetical protein
MAIKLGRYRHFKGKEYQLIGIAKDSETLEDLAVYKALYNDGQLWVRPLKIFLEEVKKDGQKMPRFEYLGE